MVLLPFAGASNRDAAQTRAAAADLAADDGGFAGPMRAGVLLTWERPRKKACTMGPRGRCGLPQEAGAGARGALLSVNITHSQNTGSVSSFVLI